MSSRAISMLRFIAIAIFLELPIILSYFWMTGDFSVHRFNVWPITEWLINYQSGFIRRGLVGELLLRFFSNSGVVNALYVLIFWSFALYVIGFLWVYFKSNVRNANVLLVAVLVQGGIFHMGISADFYTRKENLFLIFFAVQCLLYLQIQVASESYRQYWIYGYLALLLVLSPIFLLIHEAYLFLSYPLSALLLWIVLLEHPCMKVLKAGFALLFCEVISGFLICTHFHGNVEMSQAIWDSLPLLDRLLLAPAAPYSTFGAISSLGWGLDQHLTTLYGIFSSGGIFVWLFFAFGNTLVLSYVYCEVQPVEARGVQSQYFRWVTVGFLLLLPMFLVASDWGRWIASITNQMILLMFVLRLSPTARLAETKAFWLSLGRRRIRASGLGFFAICVIYGLIFKMPECCSYYTEIFTPFPAYFQLLPAF